jgi:hypothetical protein
MSAAWLAVPEGVAGAAKRFLCSQDQFSVLGQPQPVFPALVLDHELATLAEQLAARDASAYARSLRVGARIPRGLWCSGIRNHPRTITVLISIVNGGARDEFNAAGIRTFPSRF